MFRCLKRFCKREGEGERDITPEVYVLKLSHDKYYVGESMDPQKRILSHRLGNGSGWTKNYEVLSQEEPSFKKQEKFWELAETLDKMRLYGIDNVRGSMFTNPNFLKKEEKIMAAQLYCEMNNLCRKCGRDGHFINSCLYTDKAEWVSNFGGELELTNTIRKCLKCSKNINSSPSYYKYCNSCFKNHI
jgi:hypothetical protein